MTPVASTTPPSRRTDLLAASLIGLTAVATLVLVLHHPVLQGRGDIGREAAGIEALAGMDRFIHGGLMAVMFAQAVGFYLFSARSAPAGPRSPPASWRLRAAWW